MSWLAACGAVCSTRNERLQLLLLLFRLVAGRWLSIFGRLGLAIRVGLGSWDPAAPFDQLLAFGHEQLEHFRRARADGRVWRTVDDKIDLVESVQVPFPVRQQRSPFDQL